MPNVSRTLKGGDFVLAYFRDNYTPSLIKKFVQVYTAESLLVPFDESIQQRILNRYGEIYTMATRVLSSAEINTVERCINNMGHLNETPIITPESVGGHTNLVSILIDEVLDFTYGYDKAPKEFNRRHIRDAARIHDLPEIHYGDTRDDGIRNEAVKQEREGKFFQEYDKFLQENQKDSILRLLQEMEESLHRQANFFTSQIKLLPQSPLWHTKKNMPNAKWEQKKCGANCHDSLWTN